MKIGRPIRKIDVKPATLPLPEKVPAPERIPERVPAR
jgi:hypothetical protein